VSDQRYAERAARFLRAARARLGPHAGGGPEQEIAQLARAIERAWRRRRRRAQLLVGLAAALVVATGTAWRLRAFHARDVTSARSSAGVATTGAMPVAAPFVVSTASRAAFIGGRWIETASGAVLAAGEKIRARAISVVLEGRDGTTVVLAPDSEVAVLRSDAVRWLMLERGSLDAHVSKLGPGQRFVVATSDREVEVHGTRFHVERVPPADCGQGTLTRVAVEEGVVTVRMPDGGTPQRLAAGQHFPADCQVVATTPAESADRRPVPSARRRAKLAGDTAGAGRIPDTSTLDAENDLFAQAIRAERSADLPAALRALDALLARYPASPLRAAAASERARVLGSLNGARSASAPGAH
jgi:hypothetical protein